MKIQETVKSPIFPFDKSSTRRAEQALERFEADSAKITILYHFKRLRALKSRKRELGECNALD